MIKFKATLERVNANLERVNIDADGNDYGLGHATRHYREGGVHSRLGGYALFLSWNPQ